MTGLTAAESALLDVLDGQYKWWEIHEHTGLSHSRCKQIEAIYHEARENERRLREAIKEGRTI